MNDSRSVLPARHPLAVGDRSFALPEAVERAQHDLAGVVDGVPAGLGDVVVADIVGMDVDGAEVARHAVSVASHQRTVHFGKTDQSRKEPGHARTTSPDGAGSRRGEGRN